MLFASRGIRKCVYVCTMWSSLEKQRLRHTYQRHVRDLSSGSASLGMCSVVRQLGSCVGGHRLYQIELHVERYVLQYTHHGLDETVYYFYV